MDQTTYTDLDGAWNYSSRGLIYFNLATLPTNAVINSATFKIYGSTKTFNAGYPKAGESNYAEPQIGIYLIENPINGTVNKYDYFSCNDDAVDNLQTPVTTGYNQFSLNGLAKDRLLNANRFVGFCLRNSYDAKYFEPNKHGSAYSWSWLWYDRSSGTPPTLSIDYTVPTTATGYLTTANQMNTDKAVQMLTGANTITEASGNKTLAYVGLGMTGGAILLGAIFARLNHRE